jgi:hypothetical protein
MTILFVIILYPIATLFLAPRSFRYFSQWKNSGKSTHLIASSAYGILSLFMITVIFAVCLKPFIESKIPFH